MSRSTARISQIVPLGAEQPRVPPRSRPPFSQVKPLTVLQTLVVMVCLYVFTQVLATAGPTMFAFGVGMRYLLWPLILIGAATHIMLRGVSDILTPPALFFPVFAIGIVSALISLEPIQAARDLCFWLLLVLAATAAGRQLGERLTGQLLFWGFAFLMLLSIVITVLLPKIGLTQDLRVAGGTWKGVFPGKNFLGWYAAISLLTAVTAPGVRWKMRALAVTMAVVCLYFAHSSGATGQAVVLLGFVGTLHATRRLHMSAAMKGMLIGTIALVTLAAGILFWDQLLGLLGRDATLTGRTVIWRLYFDRAMESWFLGAGPGSFTHSSLTTQDIGLSLQAFGQIKTPHNTYIATFGELGIVGLLTWLATLLYLAFVQPFRRAGPMPLMLAGMTLSLLMSGSGETHPVFGLSLATFLLLLMRASIGSAEGATRFAKNGQSVPTSVPATIPFSLVHSGQLGPKLLG